MDLFTASLEKTAEKYESSDLLLPMLGKTYVMFFYHNPLYFDFLFSRKNIKIQLSLHVSDKSENPPLEILKKTAIKQFTKANISEKKRRIK